MNFNAEDLMIRGVKREIRERETRISELQSTMRETVGQYCISHFIALTAIAEGTGNDLSCNLWSLHLYSILIVSVAFVLLFWMTMIEYLYCCNVQDYYVEKLEALKRARPGPVSF